MGSKSIYLLLFLIETKQTLKTRLIVPPYSNHYLTVSFSTVYILNFIMRPYKVSGEISHL